MTMAMAQNAREGLEGQGFSTQVNALHATFSKQSEPWHRKSIAAMGSVLLAILMLKAVLMLKRMQRLMCVC